MHYGSFIVCGAFLGSRQNRNYMIMYDVISSCLLVVWLEKAPEIE